MTAESPSESSAAGSRRRWPWVLLVLALLLVALWLALPLMLKQGVRYALTELGAEQVELDQVELSLWRGEVGIRGLRIQDEGHPPLQLDELSLRLAYRPLFERRVVIEHVYLQGVQAVLALLPDQAPHMGVAFPQPAPKAEESPEAPGQPWDFAVQLVEIAALDFRAEIPQFDAHWQIESLRFADLASWMPRQDSRLSLRSVFNGARLDLDGASQVLSESRATQLQISIQDLPLSAFAGFVRKQLPRLSGALDLDIELALHLENGTLRLEPVGSLKLAGLDLADAQGHAVRLGMNWNGKTAVSVGLEEADTSISADGSLALRDLDLALAPEQYAVQGGHIDWSGAVEVVLGNDAPRISARGAVQAGQLQVSDTARGLQLVSVGSAEVDGLDYQGPQAVRTGAIRLQSLVALMHAGKPKQRMLELDAAEISEFVLGENQARLGRVALAGGSTRLHLDRNRKLAYLSELGAPVAAAEPPSARATAQGAVLEDAELTTEAAEGEARAEPFRVQIARIELVRPHQLYFRDAGVEPPFSSELLVRKLVVTNIDTTDRAARSELELAARVGEFGKLDISGHLIPLVDPQDGRVRVDLRAVELPPLTAYGVQTIGYELDGGQLDLESDIRLQRSELEGENEISVRSLQLTKKDASRAEQFAASISMPLNSALSLLRDGDGNIKLDVPVSGRMDNPDISVQDAINQALGKALQKAAFLYVKYAIQPYGTLITLAEMATEAGKRMALNLQPVRFDAGQASLDDIGRDYLGKLSGLLAERPELSLKLCGTAVSADRAALATQLSAQEEVQGDGELKVIDTEGRLRELAHRRVSAVKQLLVNERGIDAGRLLGCNPKIEDDPDAVPEVRINI